MATPKLIPPNYSPQQIEWFWSRVAKKSAAECWPYLGALDNYGYGRVQFNRLHRRDKAHRISYWLTFNVWPAEFVCLHICDNPRCVNPYHLSLGTQLDNIEDARCKGRMAKGENCGPRKHPECIPRGEQRRSAKLTTKQVIEIREKYATGKYLQRELAVEYSVGRRAIGRVITGERWSHIPLV